MSLNAEQRQAVAALGDACVTAGAGTGKTHMLSARYIALMRSHALSPLAIVATTFTDAAATELRSRIRRDMARSGADFAPEILAELEAAPIMTMHALAARICREHPDAAGVPADFSILGDRPEGALWFAEQLDAALATLPPTVYSKIPIGLLRETIEALLADPVTAKDALARGPQDVQALLDAERQAILAEWQTDPVWQEAVLALRDCAGVGEREQQRVLANGVVQALEAYPAERVWPDVSVLDGIKLNVGSTKGWDAVAYQRVKEALRVVRDRIKAERLFRVECGVADARLAEVLPVLKSAYDTASRFMGLAKARERVLDFADLEAHALRALGDPRVLAYYQSRWRAFLLDEVQDTNPVQEHLITRLAEGAILTVVGDEKQAIYGFRRADVTVFGRLADAIGSRGGVRVGLMQSFRTHGPLMSAINRVCGPILGALGQDLQGDRPLPHVGPHIEVATTEKASKEGVETWRRVEARFIARRLKDWHDQGLMVHDKGSDALRPLRWGDVALLFRSGTAMTIYEEALAAEGIPAAMARGSDLFATREALDAWALLRWLANRDDDLALLAVLRSPFFTVADAVLHRLAQSRGKLAWWEVLANSAEPALAVARKVLADLAAQRGMRPSELLQRVDHLTGYSAVLAGMPGARRRLADWQATIAEVRALENGAQDVHTLVRRLKRLMAGEVSFDRPPLEAGDAIALMTIHAAKGLEWPVVVVPNLSASGARDSTQVRFDAQLGVALSFKDDDGDTQKPTLFEILARQQASREEAEERRIVYVALTRARDRLLLTAPEPKGGLLDIVMPGLDAAKIAVETIVPHPGDERPPQLAQPPLPAWPSRWCLDAVEVGLDEVPVTALGVYARCPRSFFYRYVACHPGAEVLLGEEDEAFGGRDEPIGSGGEVTQDAMGVGIATHVALELGLKEVADLARRMPDLSTEAVEEALTLARRFRTGEVYQALREAIVACEQAIVWKVAGLTLNGVVDAVGADFVLDYKTDRHIEPEHHAMQLWVYVQALGASRAYLAYLRHERVVGLSAEDLAPAGERVGAIARGIRNGAYPATPTQQTCSQCTFRALCPESLS
jgi:ATP-dependent helicase/nuclease subunit A